MLSYGTHIKAFIYQSIMCHSPRRKQKQIAIDYIQMSVLKRGDIKLEFVTFIHIYFIFSRS